MSESFSQPSVAQDLGEVFDVVDGDDCVVGQATRAEVHRQKLFHRAVHILVFDECGNVVLQKRSLAKDTCPGLLSTSCAGHVDAGETYDFAANRELQEELGINLSAYAGTLKFLFKMAPREELGWEFVHVYALNYAGAFHPNPAEVEALEFCAPDTLDVRILKEPQNFSESFRLVWKAFRKMGSTGCFLKEVE